MGIQGLNQMMSAYQRMTDAQKKTEKERKEEAARKAERADKEPVRSGKAGERYGDSAVYTKSEGSVSWQYENMSMSFTAARDAQKTAESEKKDGAENITSAAKNGEAGLSDQAKAYLQTLRERYTNMDFIIAGYSGDSEAQALLASGHGEYNVLIDPETLELMASDESVRAHYEDILDHAGETFDELKKELGEDAEYIKQLGISVDASGNTTYYSIIDESLKGSGERLKKQQEAKKEEKAQEEKRTEKRREEKQAEKKKQELLVKSDHLEDFLAKVREAVAGLKERPEEEAAESFA